MNKALFTLLSISTLALSASQALGGDGWAFTRRHLIAIAESRVVASEAMPLLIQQITRTGDMFDPNNATYRVRVGRVQFPDGGPYCFNVVIQDSEVFSVSMRERCSE